MKSVFILILVVNQCITFAQEQTIIEGKVTDSKTNEPIMFGTVALYQGDVLCVGTETDLDGAYFFNNVRPGTYDMEARLLGYAPQRIQGVVIKPGRTNKVNFQLSDDAVLLDLGVQIVSFRVPLIEIDNTIVGTSVTAEKINSLPTKSLNSIAAVAAGVFNKDEISVRGSRSLETVYFIDGVRVGGSAEKIKKKETETARSGLVTAGEWNDLVHWEKWSDLIREENFKHMNTYWGIYTQDRYPVFITNNLQKPIAGVKVCLMNEMDILLWSAVSDIHGRAELFMMKNENVSQLFLEYELNGKKNKIKLQKNHGKQSIHITIHEPCQKVPKANIAFVVDATGSMGDEIQFLKSDLISVLEEVEARNSDFTIQYAGVFYRDLDEEYTIRAINFDTRSDSLISFIRNQSAGGGKGNFAAVDSALMKTLDLSWEEDTQVKLVFLFLDAPPHQNNIEKYRNAIRKAAKAGIKIIPVSGSGLDRQTEFLLKFTAILTNSTYAFITNHSGIGGNHLTPVHNEFEVEKLNDLLVRIINGFIYSIPCDQPENFVDNNIQISPNPVSNVLKVSVKSDGFVEAAILSATGQILVRNSVKNEDHVMFDVQNLVSGHYYAKVVYDDRVLTKSFIKMN